MRSLTSRRGVSPAFTIAMAMLLAITIGACSRTMKQTVATPGAPPPIASLWEEPADLTTRDLFHGPGGEALRPRDTSFTFVAQDVTGHSPGFDVRDAQGVEWSVKLGPESQSEVATARILWAIGFHQPPTYHLATWTMTGGPAGTQPAGRFRPELPEHKVIGDWSWYENPFVGTREFGGLIVANLLLTNWDWKTSNNKIYAAADGNGHRYIVRDLGASLGRFSYPTLLKWFRLRGFGQGSRNHVDDFEQQGFIRGITEDRVDFHYRGIYGDVVKSVTPADVAWACERLGRLTDAQWRDSFRAAGYDEQHTGRFVAKIKTKIEEGRRLTAASRGQSPR
jgi:hypothetical protein